MHLLFAGVSADAAVSQDEHQGADCTLLFFCPSIVLAEGISVALPAMNALWSFLFNWS